MKFFLILLLLVPVTTASDGQKSEEFCEETKVAKELKKVQALGETVKGNSEFAINFFKHVTSMASQGKASTPTNVVFSPLSISSTFSMLMLGSGSKTHQEIWEGLRLNNTHCEEKEVHRAYSNLLQMLNEPKSSLRVDISNAIFLQDTLTLLKNFEDSVQDLYHAEIRKTNLTDPQKAKEEINEYVKNKTEGKIEELVKDLSKDSNMVLINLVLFKGEWQEPFHPGSTKLEKFIVDKTTTVDVPMMLRLGQYNFYRDTKLSCTVVELPYKDSASMIIAIPEPGKIHELEQRLSTETIHRWRTSFRKGPIELSLPKFSISSTINLEDALHQLGINTAFTNSADFSGITQDVGLKLDKAMHRTILDVDEKGTVAAGATTSEMVPMMLFQRLIFNRPFVLITSDKNTNSILFMGTVMNPAQK
ncbi:PREDICTED: alpha-1-antitrypsin-like [Nanorana parkeri]|uniref:alpha-1-antitrypsin-like n=1 Tax=Nanorana parkeri TaxID=125878 RepID=UPI000854E9A4|nr:PREDICTED: alpha-1-antitrypsin-like [Nanorana parkeri]